MAHASKSRRLKNAIRRMRIKRIENSLGYKKLIEDMIAVLKESGVTFPLKKSSTPLRALNLYPSTFVLLDENNQFVTYPAPPSFSA
jgi:hypothetical protein